MPTIASSLPQASMRSPRTVVPVAASYSRHCRSTASRGGGRRRRACAPAWAGVPRLPLGHVERVLGELPGEVLVEWPDPPGQREDHVEQPRHRLGGVEPALQRAAVAVGLERAVEVVEVLDVPGGDDEYAAAVGRPPLRRDPGIGEVFAGDDVGRLVALVGRPAEQPAERTVLAGRLVVPHGPNLRPRRSPSADAVMRARIGRRTPARHLAPAPARPSRAERTPSRRPRAAEFLY